MYAGVIVHAWRVSVLFLASALLLGCGSNFSRQGSMTTDCAEITNTPLAGVFQQADVTSYLQQEFDETISPQSATLSSSANISWTETVYEWNNDAVTYQVIAADYRPRSASVVYQQGQPALVRTVECLGTPGFYSFRYTSFPDLGPFLAAELFYPDKGAIVSVGSVFARLDPTSNTAAALAPLLPVDAITFVTPNNGVATMNWLANSLSWEPGEAAKEAYVQGNQFYLATVQPWPRTVEAMKLTYIAEYLLMEATPESPLQPTAIP